MKDQQTYDKEIDSLIKKIGALFERHVKKDRFTQLKGNVDIMADALAQQCKKHGIELIVMMASKNDLGHGAKGYSLAQIEEEESLFNSPSILNTISTLPRKIFHQMVHGIDDIPLIGVYGKDLERADNLFPLSSKLSEKPQAQS